MELLFHMSSHVRDVITLSLFILVILFLWSLMSISSLTWLWGASVNDYALFFHIGLVTLEYLGLWLEMSTSVKLSKADSTLGIRLSRMAMQERLLFSSFFPYVFEIAQPDFTRKDVAVNGVTRTCPELTGYLLIFLWLRHVIFVAILMSSKILVNVPSRGFTASSCPILRVTCRHVLRKEGKHKESKNEREREREHMEMTLSIHWRMTHGLSVSHTSHSITRNTLSFELSLLFSCFIVHSFWKGMSCLKTLLFQNNWKHCFSFTNLDSFFSKRVWQKKTNFFLRRNTFFICVEDGIAWYVRSDVTDLVRGSRLSFFCSFLLFYKKQEEDTRKRSWAEEEENWTKKDFKKGGKAFFRNKIDKIKLDMSKNKFWEVHKNGLLILISSCIFLPPKNHRF